GLALNNCNSVYKFCPPATGYFPSNKRTSGNGYGPITFFLLPYIEQEGLWKNSVSTVTGIYDVNDYRNGLGNYPGTFPPPPVYVCPSDPSFKGNRDGIGIGYPGWGACCYAVNWQAFGNARAPSSANAYGWQTYPSLASDFPDGTSNTIAFAEKY